MSLEQSIKTRLVNIARKQNSPYERILTSFFLERAVARLVANKKLYKHLCFKGGFVSLRHYGSDRFTKDIDAAAIQIEKIDVIETIKAAMILPMEDGVWFDFHEQEIIKGQGGYQGISFRYRAGLGSEKKHISKSQIIEIDIGMGDIIVPKPQKTKLKPLLDSNEIAWQIYKIETIIAEKLHGLFVFGSASSRAKDIFDIVTFLPKAEPKVLKEALAATFNKRKTSLPQSLSDSLSQLDTNILRKSWKTSVGYIKNAPDFLETFEKLVSYLKSEGI